MLQQEQFDALARSERQERARYVRDRLHKRNSDVCALFPTEVDAEKDDGLVVILRMRQLCETGFGNYSISKGPQQIVMMDMMMRAVARACVGSSWAVHAAEICEDFGWPPNPPRQTICQTGRRIGKSFSIGMTTAAAAITKKHTINIYSQFLRQSTLMLDTIASMLETAGIRGKENIIRKQGEIRVRVVAGLDSSEWTLIRALPGNNPDGLRGLDATLVIVDEAAFCPQKLFTGGILPLLLVGDTPIILISSPNHVAGPSSFFNSMMAMEMDSGMNRWNKYAFNLVCEACHERNPVLKECWHQMALLPPWFSLERFRELEEMYSGLGSGGKDAFSMEVLGRRNADGGFFEEWLLTGLEKRAPAVLPPDDEVPYVFTCVDPNGGGSSEAAVVSAYFFEGVMTIVSVSAWAAKNHTEEDELVTSHLEGLRQIPQLRNSRIIFLTENGGNHSASRIGKMVRERFTNVFVVCEKNLNQPGWYNTEFLKLDFAERFKKKLQESAVCFSSQFRSDCPFEDPETRTVTSRRHLMAHLRLMSTPEIISERLTASGKTHMRYTGKYNAAGIRTGQNDDLSICIGLLVGMYSIWVSHQLPFWDYLVWPVI